MFSSISFAYHHVLSALQREKGLSRERIDRLSIQLQFLYLFVRLSDRRFRTRKSVEWRCSVAGDVSEPHMGLCASCTQCRGAGRRSCLVLCLVYLTATGRSATLCALGLYSRVTTVENDAYPRIICPCRRHRMYFTSPLWIPPAGTGKGVTSSGQPSLNLAVVQPSRS